MKCCKNQRSKQDMAYDQAANPKKYLDALIVKRAKELGMTYNQLRINIEEASIASKAATKVWIALTTSFVR